VTARSVQNLKVKEQAREHEAGGAGRTGLDFKLARASPVPAILFCKKFTHSY